jgi:hypothetical protein
VVGNEENMRDTYSGGVVQVEMAFLDRLSVVALRVRETEQTLFQELTVVVST